MIIALVAAPRGRGASSDSRPWMARRAGGLHLRAAADGSDSSSEGLFGPFVSPAQ